MTPADLSRLLALLHPTYPKEPPPPALGMRVWASNSEEIRCIDFYCVNDYSAGYKRCGWEGIIGSSASITHITDFRTGEILWRRT